MKFIQDYVKICQLVQKLKGGRGCMHMHAQAAW